ncbi:MAG: hypothetical protein J7521_07560 [Caulobacter sp.]|nr:hypothetical protein [Caulobacter sp.]
MSSQSDVPKGLSNDLEEAARRSNAEALLDEALEETFPASDPISPAGVD